MNKCRLLPSFAVAVPFVFLVACGAKVEPRDSAPAPAPASNTTPTNDTGSTTTTTSPAGAPTPIPGGIRNDLTDDALARQCDDFRYKWAGEIHDDGGVFGGANRVFVVEGSTETTPSDGKFVASLTFVLEGDAVKWRDPAHGASRTDTYSTMIFSLTSDVARTDVFTAGKTENIEFGGGLGYSSWCAEDGNNFTTGGSAPDDPWKGTLTITKRDAERIAGVIALTPPTGGSPHRSTFEVVLSEPLANVCCLR